MNRRHPQLLPFLRNGLLERRYPNLNFEQNSNSIFSICLPHRSSRRLNAEYEQILKDFYQLRNREYGPEDYRKAKFTLMFSLRKSVGLEKINADRGKLTYRFLSEEEIRERRRPITELLIQNPVDYQPPVEEVIVQNLDNGELI